MLDTNHRTLTALTYKVKHFVPTNMNDIEKNKENVALENTCPHEVPICTNHNYEHIVKIDSSFQPALSDSMEIEATNADEFIMKIIPTDDPRCSHEGFKLAKKNQVKGLLEKSIRKIVHRSVAASDGTLLSGRFLYTVKNVGTPYKRAKVLFVAQGFYDQDKSHIIHDIAAFQTSSIGLLPSYAALLKFPSFSHDVAQTYIYSKQRLLKDIYSCVKAEDLQTIGMLKNELLLLNKPLYGPCNTGGYRRIPLKKKIYQ